MHNASQGSFNPNTGLVYIPINPSSTISFTAAETFTPTPGAQNLGLAGRGATAAPLATPPPYGPIRKGADGNPIRGGILTAWDPVTQKERWFAVGGGQTGGGTLSTISNLVFQTTPQGQLRAYSADRGEKLFDAPIGQTGGIGPPMTYQLDGKQYIAFMAGQGVQTGGRGGAQGAPPVPAIPINPRLYVYTVDPK
jgi:hypothetical protein